jgi:hypothetical protein
MHFEKKNLVEFLEEVDRCLEKNIDIVAAGGTAMTLLDIKSSTIDIDFIVNSSDLEDFRKALNSIPHGYRIDLFKDGFVFSQKLPEDYAEKSIAIKKLRRIRLYALNPLDIIVSKIGRLNERDMQDIRDCIRKFRITKEEIENRANKTEYVGREENYKINLRYVLENLAR